MGFVFAALAFGWLVFLFWGVVGNGIAGLHPKSGWRWAIFAAGWVTCLLVEHWLSF